MFSLSVGRNIHVRADGYVSPTFAVPAEVTDVDLVIDTPQGWDTAAGTWSWAIDYQRPDGTWNVLVGQGHLADPNAPDCILGARDKNGGLPSVGYTSAALGGLTVRVRFWASEAITLSLSGTLSQNGA